ncbi:MAG: glycosyltransferase [Candidatus Vogelbacteria bacterium CG10_big_fil_rev_8_21_14_0_10_51_16]|uniref:Glycosyltransferase n=1 Tax=Candidatus Vogelbacteria bacterium CG10_big_fil_rev_8_21_14_0_10_51_16 TaxID=1975045 RepID=A0A2H0REK1_9BACT|nr:MAG: glycosyltransferase [Candidatus Vogelbacteria bacterium CG10_big_fil_rev_8_21_14_0_10_51_16]
MKPHRIEKVSIVIPVYNEEGNIPNLYKELVDVLYTTKKEYEVIYVDDCSNDASLEILESLFANDIRVQVISLLGNQGQTIALSAGLKHAVGDVVIAMDGDGQHDPKYIPEFIKAIEEGNDLASSWKEEDQRDSNFLALLSRIFHKLVSSFTGAKMKYFGSTMKAYRRELVRNLDLSGDLHRFAGALVYYKGIRIKEIPIRIRKRLKGESAYGFGKIFRVALDLLLIKFLTKYAKAPFRLFGTISFLGIIVGLFGIGLVTYYKYVLGLPSQQNTGLLIVSAIGIIVSVQLLVFGFLAELISRIYHTSDQKGLYAVRTHLRHQDICE